MVQKPGIYTAQSYFSGCNICFTIDRQKLAHALLPQQQLLPLHSFTETYVHTLRLPHPLAHKCKHSNTAVHRKHKGEHLGIDRMMKSSGKINRYISLVF